MYGQNPYSQYPYTGYSYPNYNRPMAQQQQIMQPQMQQVQSQPIMPTLCYAKLEEAKPYIITNPNTSMLFIDREKGKALLKSTDNVCNSNSRYFDIHETDENGNPLQVQKQEQLAQMDFSQFAKKEELDGFVTIAQYNDLVEQLNTMKKIVVNGSYEKQKQAENKPLSNGLQEGRINTRQ